MSNNRNAQRSTSPVNPENSALADELRRNLKGKPTTAGFNRSLPHEIFGFLGDLVKIFVVLLLCISFTLGGFGAGMLLGYASTTKPLSIGDLTTADEVQTSFVYDSQGRIITKLTGTENVDRIYIPFGEVKNTFIDEAIISIEDERFYEHSGIDLKRIGSAVLSALANSGSATHGGSTITQQTIKLISGQDEHSTSRKVQEWFSAMSLEQELSKDEIMELYINLAPMGNNYVGIQTAAQNYFGKNASELTLPECALLAGLPKSPSYYNPMRETGRRNALRRMRIVLGKMYELGKIDEKQYREALNSDVKFKTREKKSYNAVNSYFAEYAISEVISDLAKARGISKELASSIVYNRGYHIYTTLEPDVQAILDEAFKNKDLFQKKPSKIEDYPEKPNGSMVVVNVSTGAIAAMQGGFGEKTMNLAWNRATASRRNPGSSIKPLLDYAPAIELGLVVPSTLFTDQKVYLDPSNPKRPWPKNYENNYIGPLTVRQALVKSRNTIAAMLWREVGGDTALWYLAQNGIDRTSEGSFPSQSVGGFTNGMTTLEMAAAYATFANGGTYCEPYSYTKVLDSDENLIMSSDPAKRKVFSAETCFLVADMLMGVVTSGTPSKFGGQIKGLDGAKISTAGKTGTTSDNNDKWFCGFTPYYAAAVWYGYDNRLRQTEIIKDDYRNAVHIWMYCMQKIHANLEGAKFERPESIVQASVCTESGCYATDECKAAGTVVTDYFISGSDFCPKKDNPCTIHKPEPSPTPAPGFMP